VTAHMAETPVPMAFLTLGFWEVVVLVVALAVLLGVPMIVVAVWMRLRRVIDRRRGAGPSRR